MRQESIPRELSMEVIVGAFILMVLLGLGYFTIILSREAWFLKKYQVEVVFDTVMGLRESDNVVVRGMPVGTIKSLDLNSDGVHVVASVETPLDMRDDYRVRVVSTSVLGGRYMEIFEGSGQTNLPLATTVFQGEKSSDLMDDAREVISAVRKEFAEGGLIANLREASSELRDMIGRVADGEGTIGRLLSSDDQLYRDLTNTVGSLSVVAQRLEAGEGTLGKLLAEDDEVYRDLRDTMASLKEVSERLNRGEGTLGKLLSSDDQVYDDLSATVSSLKEVAGKIERGEGVLGKLVNDDKLYTEIEETVGELRATVDDFRETSPITTFTSIFFGAF